MHMETVARRILVRLITTIKTIIAQHTRLIYRAVITRCMTELRAKLSPEQNQAMSFTGAIGIPMYVQKVGKASKCLGIL